MTYVGKETELFSLALVQISYADSYSAYEVESKPLSCMASALTLDPGQKSESPLHGPNQLQTFVMHTVTNLEAMIDPRVSQK